VLRFEPVDVLLIQEVEAINIWDVPQAMLLAVLTRGNVSNVVLVEDGNAKGIWLVRWKISTSMAICAMSSLAGGGQNRLLKVEKF
jgi:hypothetical protein